MVMTENGKGPKMDFLVEANGNEKLIKAKLL
jgi:hypothetical protein